MEKPNLIINNVQRWRGPTTVSVNIFYLTMQFILCYKRIICDSSRLLRDYLIETLSGG